MRSKYSETCPVLANCFKFTQTKYWYIYILNNNRHFFVYLSVIKAFIFEALSAQSKIEKLNPFKRSHTTATGSAAGVGIIRCATTLHHMTTASGRMVGWSVTEIRMHFQYSYFVTVLIYIWHKFGLPRLTPECQQGFCVLFCFVSNYFVMPY